MDGWMDGTEIERETRTKRGGEVGERGAVVETQTTFREWFQPDKVGGGGFARYD
jgi:hypothetical protein